MIKSIVPHFPILVKEKAMKDSVKIIFISAIALFIIGFAVFASLFAKLFYTRRLLGERVNVFNPQYLETCETALYKSYLQ